MKKTLIIIGLCILCISMAQSQSTTLAPGSVLPQVTTAQRTAITSPNGVLVFDTNTQSYWFRKSGAWIELPAGGSPLNYWSLSGIGGNVIKNTNSGGFWSENPAGLNSFSDNTTNPPTAPVAGDGTRMMWIPSRSAFRAGTVAEGFKSWDKDSVGLFSTAFGYNTQASKSGTTAMGYLTTASGSGSTAIGITNTASGTGSTAIGYNNTASDVASTAMGFYNNASGYYSTAIGSETNASGSYSTAIGRQTTASGNNATAMGFETIASGNYSTAMGDNTIALGRNSTAMGFNTTAGGDYSTAMGNYASTFTYNGAFVIGDKSTTNLLFALENNSFSARFSRGYRLFTNAAMTNGVSLGANANSWSSISDSTKKERFVAYNPEKVLSSVATMRVGTWNYKGDTRPNGRHWGVMAQDFYQHFGKDQYGTVGCDTLIATADFDGVAFAAIKALELRTRELQEENRILKADLNKKDSLLQTQNQELNAKLARHENEIQKQSSKINEFESLKEELATLKIMLVNTKEPNQNNK